MTGISGPLPTSHRETQRLVDRSKISPSPPTSKKSAKACPHLRQTVPNGFRSVPPARFLFQVMGDRGSSGKRAIWAINGE